MATKISPLKRGITPNRLDAYDLTTYHLTFYMLPETVDITSFDQLAPSNGIIIAESGVTSQIFIENFTTTNYVSMSKQSQNANYSMMNMRLREFSGASMLDRIYAASLELDINTYYKVPYFIELSFLANSPGTGEPVKLTNDVWRWPIMVKSMTTSVYAGGSTYDVLAVHYKETAQQDQYGVIKKSTSTLGKGTLKEVFADLTRQLNEQSKTQANLLQVKPDEYEIILDGEDISKLEVFDSVSAATLDGTQVSTEEAGQGAKRNVQSEKNITIVDFINRVISNAPKYQEFARNTNTPADVENNANAIKRLHRVVTESQVISFDIARGDYQRKFTYRIKEYKIGQLQAVPTDALARTDERYRNYVNDNLILKHYKYIFTGENDQIIDLDLTFNNAWYVNMPPKGGFFTTHSSKAEGEQFTDEYETVAELRRQIANYDQNKAVTIRRLGVSPYNAEAALREAIKTGQYTEEEQLELNRLVDIATKSRLIAAERKANKGKENGTDGAAATTRGPQRYVSDYTFTPDLEKQKSLSYRSYPLSYIETDLGTIAGLDWMKSVTTGNDTGRASVNSLFQQAFSGISGDIANIEMTIKGDPTWLGEPGQTGSLEPEIAAVGQPAFLLSLRTPDLPGVDTGVILSRSSMINGLYLVKRIDHEFTNGLFTQKLYSVIDPLIDLNEVLNDPSLLQYTSAVATEDTTYLVQKNLTRAEDDIFTPSEEKDVYQDLIDNRPDTRQ